MTDMEKVIKGLESHQIDINHRINCADCPYYVNDDNHIRCVNDLHHDAITILKERESIVKCKDCIHFTQDNIPTDGCGFCELLSRTYSRNDYCSYGERRTDDV